MSCAGCPLPTATASVRPRLTRRCMAGFSMHPSRLASGCPAVPTALRVQRTLFASPKLRLVPDGAHSPQTATSCGTLTSPPE
eukprot:531560-Prymnesium_polylepis.1